MSRIINSGARLTEMRQRDIQPQEMERAHPLERRFPLHPSLTSFIYTADDSDCRRPTRRDKSGLSSSQHPPSRHQRPAKSVSFPALFRVLLLRFGRLSLRSILRMFFWEGTNRRPPRRLIQPLGMEGNAMVTLNVYADIEPMSKIQNMLRVAPALRGKSSRRSR